MIRALRPAACLLVLVAVVDPAIAQEPAAPRQLTKSEIVQADIKTNSKAVYAGDIKVVLSYTHPKIIQLMGGMQSTQKTLKAALAQIGKLGMSLESLKFPDDPTFISTDENEFAIVPTLSIIAVGQQRIESLNYQFGVRGLRDRKWAYIEGSRINQGNVRSLFPDFPKSFVFPKTYRKPLP